MASSPLSSQPILTVKNLACIQQERTIISGISFEIHAGDCLVLTGRSGSGKSTLLKCLAHLNVYNGEILLNGKTPLEYGIAKYRTLVQYVPQRPSLLPSTPKAFLETLRSFKSRQGSQVHSSEVDDPIEMAKSWGIPDSAWDRNWSTLSGGETQRVALALAVGLPGAEILLLDEPTSALDEETSAMIEKSLHQLLQRQGTLKAIVWITHSPAQEHRVATRHLSLETGGALHVCDT